MGARGPRRREADKAQGHRRPATGLVVLPPPTDDEPEIPPLPVPPKEVLVSTRQAWDAFWRAPTAPAFETVDRVVAERWILAYDEWRRALNAVRRKRIVPGSMGQPVMNPLTNWVASRERAMRQAEKEMGVGLKSRADLGVSVGQAQLTAAELNRMTEDSDGGDQEAGVIDAEEAQLLEGFEEAR